MRTPNCSCVVCGEELYRRPYELKQVSYVCCRKCKSEALKIYQTEKSLDCLKLGRNKGENHLTGIPKSNAHKAKMSIIMTNWCKNNVDKVKVRGKKTRGENHYNWKDNATKLNNQVRTLTKYIKWVFNVKQRDGFHCVLCGSTLCLEAHHVAELTELIERHNITDINEAENCDYLWDISNGRCLCMECHYFVHNRELSESFNDGKVYSKQCLNCGTSFIKEKPSITKQRMFCSKECRYGYSRRKIIRENAR